MRLIDRLFSRQASAVPSGARAIMDKAWVGPEKPFGGAKAAELGADIRRRLFTLIEQVEADLGGTAIGFVASDDMAMMVHPKLREAIEPSPFRDVLNMALTFCFLTKKARRRVIETWPSTVAQYKGKNNSDAVLREKSAVLATYVVSNLDATDLAGSETTDEQDWADFVEEAAVWYRVLDELAFKFLQSQRDMLMDFLRDDLARHLALMGSPPQLIVETMAERSKEYANYREWAPAKNAALKGTLLWEAAKHVAEAIGRSGDPLFLAQYGPRFLAKLTYLSPRELLVGSR
jgi:hypothetical protein